MIPDPDYMRQRRPGTNALASLTQPGAPMQSPALGIPMAPRPTHPHPFAQWWAAQQHGPRPGGWQPGAGYPGFELPHPAIGLMPQPGYGQPNMLAQLGGLRRPMPIVRR